jgi:hypothetical protein
LFSLSSRATRSFSARSSSISLLTSISVMYFFQNGLMYFISKQCCTNSNRNDYTVAIATTYV